MLADPDQMDLRAEESAALYDTVRLFDGTGFAAEPLDGRCRACACPKACGRPPPALPWPAAETGGSRTPKPVRGAGCSEIQMAWHDHPVNRRARRRRRSTRWLYGGARPAHRAARTALILDGLDAPNARLGRLAGRAAALDAQLRARSGKQGLPDAPTELLLLGDDRSVALTLKPRGSLLLAKKNWSAWWSHPLTVRPQPGRAAPRRPRASIPLARLWAARVTHPDQTKLAWPALLPPAGLTHSAHAAGVLADAIQAGRRLLIVADYDCDGATACAVGLRALSAMGADVDFLVPNRFETGYACRLPWSTWP